MPHKDQFQLTFIPETNQFGKLTRAVSSSIIAYLIELGRVEVGWKNWDRERRGPNEDPLIRCHRELDLAQVETLKER